MKTAVCILFMTLALELARPAGAVVVATSPAVVELQAGASFTRARSRLLALGWKPVRMHRDEGYEYSGTEKRLIARQFHEVDSCSTDRGSLCILYYTKQGACLRVDTIGEQVNLMRVTRWEYACPDGPGMGSGVR